MIYFKMVLSGIRANKFYALLNVVGLAVAMASVLLIALFIRDEAGYDRFFNNAERIFRVAVERSYPNGVVASARTPRTLASAMGSDWPEVEQATRVSRENAERVLVQHGEARHYEEGLLFADPNFFAVFDLPLAAGDPRTALAEPFTVVITEAMAQKYFGDGDALGQTLNLRLAGDGDRFDYRVTAVAREVPANTHFHFDFLASYQGHPFTTTDSIERTSFENLDVYTYVLLQRGSDATALTARFPALVRNYLGARLQAQGVNFDRYVDAGNAFRYFLQPLTGIHLRSGLGNELEPVGSMTYVVLFTAIAAGILALACINFSNLVTAQAARRAHSIAIHKTLGSRRGQVILLFLVEACCMSLLALLPAAGIVELVLPTFNELAGKQLAFAGLFGWRAGAVLVAFALGVGIFAGLYPAVFLSGFRPAAVLRRREGRAVSPLLRNTLVIFQFAVSLVLMIGTVVMAYQMRYVEARALGFDRESVLVLEGTEVLRRQPETFTQALLRIPGVMGVTHAENMPGRIFETGFVRVDGALDGAQLSRMFTGVDYVDVLGMRVVEGQNFSRERPTDAMAVLLNERAVAALGLVDPVGTRLTWTDRNYEVIGVVEDFHYASLHEEVGPLMLTGLDPEFENRPYRFFAVRIAPGDPAGTVAALREVWDELVPQQPLSFSFLDTDIDTLYGAERKSGTLLGLFTLVAFFIACLGIYGLASFNAARRTREIGVRKVMGSSVLAIVLLLTNDYSRLVLLSNLVAWPVAYVAMDRWLENFAYRMDLTPLIFIGSSLIALCIAWVTVGGIAARAASIRPVLALRYE